MIRTARIVQLSVVCKRLVGDGVLSNECSKRFCIQDEENGSKDRAYHSRSVTASLPQPSYETNGPTLCCCADQRSNSLLLCRPTVQLFVAVQTNGPTLCCCADQRSNSLLLCRSTVQPVPAGLTQPACPSQSVTGSLPQPAYHSQSVTASVSRAAYISQPTTASLSQPAYDGLSVTVSLSQLTYHTQPSKAMDGWFKAC